MYLFNYRDATVSQFACYNNGGDFQTDGHHIVMVNHQSKYCYINSVEDGLIMKIYLDFIPEIYTVNMSYDFIYTEDDQYLYLIFNTDTNSNLYKFNIEQQELVQQVELAPILTNYTICIDRVRRLIICWITKGLIYIYNFDLQLHSVIDTKNKIYDMVACQGGVVAIYQMIFEDNRSHNLHTFFYYLKSKK
jgi:hypothetical protein